MVTSLYGQELPSQINVIPPSPNVMAMNKFVDVPVGHYTGTPNISVPIYELKMQQMSLPIGLSYHASGLKVEEHASWVGAGWALNAGGTVNRTIRGLADEYAPAGSALPGMKGYFFNDKMFTSSDLLNITKLNCDGPSAYPVEGEALTTLDSLVQGHLDMEPDLYTYSFPGGSGKFVFNRDQEIIKVTSDDIKITDHPFQGSFTPLNNSGAVLGYEWTIRGADGILYTFKNAERTETGGGCGFAIPFYENETVRVETAWHLDKMSIGGEWIQFHYVDETVIYDTKVTSNQRFKVDGTSSDGGGVTACTSSNITLAKRLDKITTSNGYEVKFIATVERIDIVAAGDNSKRLEKIEVFKDGNLINAYNLAYSYYNSNIKLKLNSVKQTDGITELPGYEFSYFTGNLPSKDSNSQDFWGYYNQASNLGGVIPKYKSQAVHVDGGANRDPVLSATKIGALEKITYPTGGNSQFVYELHDYFEFSGNETIIKTVSASGNPALTNTDTKLFSLTGTTYATLTATGIIEPGSNVEVRRWNGSAYVLFTPTQISGGNRVSMPAGDYQLFVQNSNNGTNTYSIEYEQTGDFQATGGGLRVAQVKIYDPATDKNLIKKLEYTQSNGNSSGILFTPPIFGSDAIRHVGGVGSGALCATNGEAAYFVTVNSVNQLPTGIYHGSPIGYSRVTESQVDSAVPAVAYENGKLVYTFINEKGTANFGYPFVSQQDLSYKNGKPLTESVYKSEGGSILKVSETVNIYAEVTNPVSATGYKIAFAETSDCYACNTTDYVHNQYNNISKWHYLQSSTETNYDDLGNALEVETDYTYFASTTPDHHLPLSKKWDNSEGEEVEMLYARNAVNPALLTNVKTKVDGQLVAGQNFTYFGKLPQTMSKLNLDGQVSGESYHHMMSYSFGAGSVLIQAQQYPRETLGGTDKGMVKSFIWGYNDAYPIAEVTNAKSDEIAYSSFEASHTGNWTYTGSTVIDSDSPTGGKHFYLNTSTVTKVGLSTDKTYILSYWAKSGTPSVIGSPGSTITSRDAVYTDAHGWSYYEKTLKETTSITIIGNASLDELRLYPQGAEMRTLTYKPGVGQTSESSANGLTVKYVYDSFNRLTKILDRDGNTIRLFDYSYRQSIPNN